MFRINTFAVLYDISTENTSFAAFILHLIFHTNTSFPFCLPSCKTSKLIICYTLSSITEKKPKACRTMGLILSQGNE
nr:MAG TPA: bacteriocin [Caudoviricetes sp.]